jgi:hypothetical protein
MRQEMPEKGHISRSLFLSMILGFILTFGENGLLAIKIASTIQNSKHYKEGRENKDG